MSKILLNTGLQEVLPIKNPSTSLSLIRFSVLVSVTAPPYKTLVDYATSGLTFLVNHERMNSRPS